MPIDPNAATGSLAPVLVIESLRGGFVVSAHGSRTTWPRQVIASREDLLAFVESWSASLSKPPETVER